MKIHCLFYHHDGPLAIHDNPLHTGRPISSQWLSMFIWRERNLANLANLMLILVWRETAKTKNESCILDYIMGWGGVTNRKCRCAKVDVKVWERKRTDDNT
jgi:hypothetical protein